MPTLEQKYRGYRNQLRELNEQKDAWYTIASQKFSEGDKKGQKAAYAEIDKIQKKVDALVDPRLDEPLKGDEGELKFNS